MSEINRLTGDSKQNIELLKSLVKTVYLDAPIIGDLCLAQGILESRLLGHPSSLAKDYNNLFGIKGHGTAGTVYLPTTEYIKPNKAITTTVGFAKNLSLIDSIKQHRHVLELPRYKKVWTSQTFEEAANEVRLAGYATDPAYSKSLIEVYNNHIKSPNMNDKG